MSDLFEFLRGYNLRAFRGYFYLSKSLEKFFIFFIVVKVRGITVDLKMDYFEKVNKYGNNSIFK
jgi:hypothetical protein